MFYRFHNWAEVKMEDKDWKEIKHFKKQDAWGDPSLMSKALILELDRFREHIKTPILVTCGTQGKHAVGSYHYEGLAVDVVFPRVEKCDLPEIVMASFRFKFTGIGVYSNWKYHDTVIGGMHLDLRPGNVRSMWMGVDGHYIGLSFKNLSDYFYAPVSELVRT